MKQNRKYTISYAVIATLGGGALLIGGMFFPAVWLLGVLLAPITLALFRSMSRGRALLFGVALSVMCLVGAPTVGLGAVLFVLWYGGAVVCDQFTRRSPDLFGVLFYGGTLYGLGFCGAICLCIKEYFGVWDIRGLFTLLEQSFIEAVDVAERLYAESMDAMLQTVEMDLSGTGMENIAARFDLYRSGAEIFAYLMICMVLSGVLIHLFLTLQVGKRLCHKAGLPLQVLPLQLLTVPAEITVAYMIVYTVGMFLINTDYGYALVIANVLVGYLFVLAGIGWVDSKMQKFPAALRTLIKTILLFAAFFRENLVIGIVYNLLMLPGLFISLSRRVIIRRTKGDDQ